MEKGGVAGVQELQEGEFRIQNSGVRIQESGVLIGPPRTLVTRSEIVIELELELELV
jgi:hypothetical protein